MRGICRGALLLDAAVLVNQQDELRAATPVFRSSVADAVLEAVKEPTKQCSGSCKLPSFKLL